MRKKVVIGGITVDNLSSNEMATLMVRDVKARLQYPKLVFSANGHGVSLAATNAKFAADLAQGDIRHADGMSIVFAARLFTGTSLPERIGTTDFFHNAARAAEKHKLKFYFLGATQNVVRTAYRKARKLYPNIEWVGFRNGYFDINEESEVCREIVASRADVVWVGLGRPKQEAFCVRNKDLLRGVTWMKTCGGLFDFLSGKNNRAPGWMQSLGLEWAYRVLQEPRRLAWRYAVTNTHSLLLFMTKSGSVTENTDQLMDAGRMNFRVASDLRQRQKAVFIVSFMNKAGAQRSAHRLAYGFLERGWDSELWFLYKVDDDSFKGLPVRVFHESPSPGVKGYLAILRDVVAAMRASRPDAVVSFLPLASVIGQTAALLNHVPSRVASLRSSPLTFSLPMRQLDKLFGTLGIYTRIISVSQSVANTVESYPSRYRRIIDVVHNGVQSVTTDMTAREARQMLGLPQGVTIVLTVGRIAAQKNYPFLLDIAEQIRHAHLVCVGDGPDRILIEQEIKRRGLSTRLTLLGAMPADRISLVYTAADVFIQPSLFEGQSNALLEAMSAQLPVIVSDVPSQAEVVLEMGGPWGLALPLKNAKTWATAIDRFATDPVHRKKFSVLAGERASHFPVSSQIDGFEAVLRGKSVPARKRSTFADTHDPAGG